MAFVAALLALISATLAWIGAPVALARTSVPALQTLAVWLSYWTVTGWLFFLVLAGLFFVLFRPLSGSHGAHVSQFK
jgi:hypothetical protein